ncbi:MAG TPA: sialidase family protein, partial [Blastocatellia bacterium]|nr:sialidase family protein [Blastocatellia bacterium]
MGLMRAPHAQESLEFVVDAPVLPNSDLDPRNEPSIAVSPVNSSIIVGASKIILGAGGGSSGETRVAYYHSSDGGLSWGSSLLGLETPQKTWGRATDPSVAADLDGNFYLCVLMLDSASFDTGVYVYKSTDAGRSFSNPTPVVADIGNGANAKRADKCYIAVDRSSTSPFKNTIYAIWVSSEPDRTVILTSHMKPGETAFSQAKTISHNGDMRGPSITTGPSGELYAAWQGIGNPRVILFNASTDGGETFLPLEAAPSIDFNIHNFT